MLSRLINALLASVGAALFSQIPEFIQQYTQRLGGAVDALSEARRRIAAEATAFGRTTEAHVAQALASGDPELRARGARDAGTLADFDRLSAAYRALSDSDGILRLRHFIETFDESLARSTLEIFRPAVPLTLENLAYAGIGLVLGIGAAWLVERSLGRLLGRKRKTE